MRDRKIAYNCAACQLGLGIPLPCNKKVNLFTNVIYVCVALMAHCTVSRGQTEGSDPDVTLVTCQMKTEPERCDLRVRVCI
jgi:hypothetical protein